MGFVWDNPRLAETVSTRKRRWTPTPLIGCSILLHAALLPALAVWPSEWTWILTLLLGDHLVVGGIGMVPRSRALGPNLTRLPVRSPSEQFVVLTFDDGPDPDVTPRVLDLLDRHDAKASFFCVGRRAERHPEIVREIVRRGHSVENHSDRHPMAFAAYHPWALHREVARAQATLTAISGRAPRFFRAPAGLRGPLLEPVLAYAGLHYASWRRRGFDQIAGDAETVLRRITRDLRAGDIVMLHDTARAPTPGGAPIVLEVLSRLLGHIGDAGWRALSLPLGLARSGLAT
jgi:peptidoglycan-N-acetylglucosamine deacetylase